MGIDRFENVANRYETQRSPRERKRERKGRGMGACAHGRYNKGKRRVHFRGACASPLLPLPTPLSVRDFEKRTRAIGESRSGPSETETTTRTRVEFRRK